MQGVLIDFEQDVFLSKRLWMGMHGATTPLSQITDVCTESELI